MQSLISRIREALGSKILQLGLRVLPKDASERVGALRGLAEQRLFDRYEGYTLLLKESPYPFERWREISGTMFLKAAALR
jgi:hypothetical protein